MGEKIVVLGAGAFGTALANTWAAAGQSVALVAKDSARAHQLQTDRENRKRLPGVLLERTLQIVSDVDEIRWSEESASAVIVVVATPTAYLRATVRAARMSNSGWLDAQAETPIWVSAAKGLEPITHATMSSVIASEVGNPHQVVALSGPSFARELATQKPTLLVVAGQNTEVVARVQKALSCETLRLYASSDLIGVELAGALKNVIAIAVGGCDGLQLGDNARAAVITRGLAEISRLGTKMGADPQTFAGLAGLGDLVLTTTGASSRNRAVGLAMGRGLSVSEALLAAGGVAEGVFAAPIALELAQKHTTELPITAQMAAVLAEERSISEAVSQLMLRPLKPEKG